MRFMLTIYNNPDTVAAIEGPDQQEFRAAHDDLINELAASGALIDTNELSVVEATVVRTTGGTMTRTDGPFTEGEDFVGGYYIVECDNIEQAARLAGRFVESRFAPVEVRALVHG
ncbi:MAG TPA: YciI family protein [Candidatus Limnocylindrales bacterium]